ncbi:hypothetical protein RIR_e46892_A0A2I1F8Z6_9GLOM [Rhizophagus irregularis DAOM 181602=DAOM 197198]|nr:hypothetical protein RIR_e46892_A0A2I1F8Z6_9GLOM [Rhizophagus irregularis DAOM 181602=DAOM 197198]
MIEEDKILRIKTFTASSFSDLTKSEVNKRICRQEQKEREFNTACKIYNATSTSAVKTLEYHCMNHTYINELNNDEHEERSSSRRFSFRKRSRINYAESLYSLEEETEPTYKMQQKKFSNTTGGIIQENRSIPVRNEKMNVSKSNDSQFVLLK